MLLNGIQLLSSVHQLISESLYNSYSAEEVIERLPGGLVDKMKALIAKIITVHMPEWGGQVLHSQVSLPRLQEFDWRLDLKSASDTMHRMSVPTVLVQLKVRITLSPPFKKFYWTRLTICNSVSTFGIKKHPSTCLQTNLLFALCRSRMRLSSLEKTPRRKMSSLK